MRAAVIKNGAVWNVVETETLEHPEFELVACLESTQIGYLWDGNEFSPAPVTAPIPQEVTMRQGRLALLAAGKLSQVDTAINALPEPDKSAARIEWEYSNTLQRTNPFVGTLGTALGMTSAEVDDLFRAAALL